MVNIFVSITPLLIALCTIRRTQDREPVERLVEGLTPADHGWQVHAGVCGYCLNRTVILAYMTILAITLIGDPGFLLVTLHPYYITWTPFKASTAANTFIRIYVFYSHYISPILFGVYKMDSCLRGNDGSLTLTSDL